VVLNSAEDDGGLIQVIYKVKERHLHSNTVAEFVNSFGT
jgi:hypothetical protein